jgi:hypothetical protein
VSDFQRRAFCALLATLALLPASDALACSPIKSIGILFDRNSAQVPAEQVLRLANWTAMLRAKYPNREAVFMTSQADFRERDASRLGVQRAKNVAKILDQDLQFSVPKVTLPSEGYVAATPAPKGSQLVRRVDVEFLPACPHECPCQMNDPLYEPRPIQ